MSAFSRHRRKFLAAGAVLGAGALAASLRPRDQGAGHSPYFQRLSAALDEAGLARPTLVVDREKLLANTDVLLRHIADKYAYRIVAKSLPSVALLETVMARSSSQRLMVFHQPFLNLIAQQIPASNILLGKPMPVAAAYRFYQHRGSGSFDPANQLQWLVDSAQRLTQYRMLAQQLQQPMLINLELDVGLHRGGIADNEELATVLNMIEQEPLLTFSGFMGYEPHVAKTPALFGGPTAAFAKAQENYNQRVAFAEQLLGRPLADSTLNAAGSPTYQMYNGTQIANELSVGSALVKPKDFDIPTLADHEPAAFIATPILKTGKVRVPGIETLSGISALLNPNTERAFFIYGGYWKAVTESPPGLANSSLYGRSTNQELLTGSASIPLQQDDWVFLRPNQSEHVFLQFGDIAVFDGKVISELWPVFAEGA